MYHSNPAVVGTSPTPTQTGAGIGLSTNVTCAVATAVIATTTTTTTTATAGLRRVDRVAPPAKSGESQETVVDSGIEELDSRSSSDHHLDSILGLGSVRGERDRADRPDRGADLLDSYMTYLDGQTYEIHNSKTTATSTYPKSQRYRDGARPGVELRRQSTSTPSALQGSLHSQRQREEEEEQESRERADEGEIAHDGFSVRTTQSLSRPATLYLERARTPEVKPHWAEGPIGPSQPAEGPTQVGSPYLEGRKIHPPLPGMKASIINELNSKLQQMGSKGSEAWGSHRSLSRHR